MGVRNVKKVYEVFVHYMLEQSDRTFKKEKISHLFDNKEMAENAMMKFVQAREMLGDSIYSPTYMHEREMTCEMSLDCMKVGR